MKQWEDNFNEWKALSTEEILIQTKERNDEKRTTD